MLTLGRFIDRLVIDPAPAVTDNLVALRHEGPERVRVLLQRAHDSEHADFHFKFLEDAQDAPIARAWAILKYALDDLASLAGIGGEARVGQHILRRSVALEHRALAARLEIEVDIDRDARFARPARVRWGWSIPAEITRWHRHVHVPGSSSGGIGLHAARVGGRLQSITVASR